MKKHMTMVMIAMLVMSIALFMVGCATPEQSTTESAPMGTEQMDGAMSDSAMTDTTMMDHEGGEGGH